MSIGQLQAEIERRQQVLTELRERRLALLAELKSVDREIASLDGRGRGRRTTTKRGGSRAAGGGRPKNDMPLADALGQVLSNATLSVSEAAAAVQAAGYKTTSPNFRTIVNQALIANSDRFKKVAHGRYTARA
ncbi:MAG: hypothetical protein ACYTJ0_04455 [Planctomycetota bacterium]|jgi:hypothetical protein